MMVSGESTLTAIALVLLGCLQIIVYRYLYCSSYRAAMTGLRRRQTMAWTSAAVSMTTWFSTVKLRGGTSPEFDAAVATVARIALKLAEVDARYRRRSERCRRRSSVASFILCLSVWIPAIAIVWTANTLDPNTATVVSILLLTTTGGMMVGIPSLAEERVASRGARRPPFLDEWSSSLVIIRDHEPEGVHDRKMWDALLPDDRMVHGIQTLMSFDVVFRRMVAEVLLRTAMSAGDVPGPEREAASAASGTESEDGGASE